VQNNFKFINWMYLINVHMSYTYSEYNVKALLDYGMYKVTDPAVFNEFEILA